MQQRCSCIVVVASRLVDDARNLLNGGLVGFIYYVIGIASLKLTGHLRLRRGAGLGILRQGALVFSLTGI